jgi:hypothetical protein
MKRGKSPKGIAGTLSDPLKETTAPVEDSDLIELRDLVTFLSFALESATSHLPK